MIQRYLISDIGAATPSPADLHRGLLHEAEALLRAVDRPRAFAQERVRGRVLVLASYRAAWPPGAHLLPKCGGARDVSDNVSNKA